MSQLLGPYQFELFSLKEVHMDSSRNVVFSSKPEIDTRILADRIQSLTQSKYERTINDAKVIDNLLTVRMDKGHYVPSYPAFYHIMIDGLPRAFPTFKNKLDLIISEHNFNLFKGLREAVEPWLPHNSISTYAGNPEAIKAANGTALYGSRNRLEANELSFFSVKHSLNYNAKVINKRIACAFWQKFAADHWIDVKPKRRLFVARMSQYYKSMRCGNQIELEQMLRKKHGFELYETDKHSFMENAKAFREAEFIIGVHGAALSHICFCHPGIKFIQLASKDVYNVFFDVLAETLNFKYRNLYGFDANNQISKTYNEVFRVPPHHMEKAIRGLK